MAATDDVYWRIKQAVAAKIVSLNLEGGDLGNGQGDLGDVGSNVYVQMLPDASNIKFPCVLVTSEGEKEEPTGGTSEHRDMWRPVRAFIADRSSIRLQESEPFYSDWRRQIYNAFHFQKLAGVDEVRGCVIVPEVIYDPRLPQYELVVSGQVLRFYCQETRR